VVRRTSENREAPCISSSSYLCQRRKGVGARGDMGASSTTLDHPGANRGEKLKREREKK